MTLFLCLAVATALLLWLRGRIQALEARGAEQDRRIALLTARIFALEGNTVAEAPPPLPVPPPVVTRAAAPMAPVLGPPPLSPVLGPRPAPPVRDLEALIGGNWLSKLGVLMLLIGIALFIGFSLTEMGPMGRILTGAATGLSLLGAGVAAERKADYRVLGSALTAGGWAGLYFTAFAAHGIEVSRVIESPGVGLLLLLGVASGMILHSLRYRNQTVTGLAYMAAFLTIAISSLTQFSAVASIPLLLSLLVVSWKFGWQALAAGGALFAYAAYGFDLATGDKDRYFISIGEPVLWIYWLLVEGFDLAAKRRGARLPIAPFNLTGFLFATAAVWPSGSGWQPGPMLAAMAAAQLVSAALRGRLSESREIVDDSVFGGFRASITYSAAFSAAFILEHFAGLQRGFALALLAESIAVSGWLFRSAYLRGLGAALFVLPVATTRYELARPLYWALAPMFLANRLFLLGGIWYSAGLVGTLGVVLAEFEIRHLRPVLLTIAGGAGALVLRLREKAEARWVGLSLAGLSVVLLATGLPKELIWVTIALPAVLYAAFGWALPEGPPRLVTFVLMQCYLLGLLYRLTGETPWLMVAWAMLALLSWAGGLLLAGESLAASALLPELLAAAYWLDALFGNKTGLTAQGIGAAALFAMHLVPSGGSSRAARLGSALHGGIAVAVTTAMVEDFVRSGRLTLAWGTEAFVLLGAGIGLQRRQLRLSGLALFALCLVKLFLYDFSQLDTLSRILSFLGLGCLLITVSWAYSRFREQIKRYL